MSRPPLPPQHRDRRRPWGTGPLRGRPLRPGPARRAATVLAPLLVAGSLAAATPTAHAAPSPKPPATTDPALYGSMDPTFDGVWRQSYALLALDTAGVKPAQETVDWLVEQQCADGGFTAFRADVARPCVAKAQDTNATAAAVQALVALGGHDAEVDRATAWLRTVQNKDGGWSFNPGNPSDTNSTSVVIGAFAAAGTDPAKVTKAGKDPFDALLGWQLGCSARAADRGAFAYQPDDKGTLYANDSATAAAALAAYGRGLPVRLADVAEYHKERKVQGDLDCAGADRDRALAPPAAADLAIEYLARRMSANGWHLDSPQKGAGPDFSTTVHAGLALAASYRTGPADSVLNWLGREADEWAKGQPAALAELILLSRATGHNPREFAGGDLVTQLVNLGPEPTSDPAEKTTKPEGKDQAAADEDDGDSGGLSVWLTVGIGLLVGIGGGFLISMRRKRG
ncbi:hypothetical protein AQ490_12015 [Wenjunlia vitaminophila]|uniref:Prenyltransferase alpha-alpha toroid domain-containing protein n=1 Tax=Wenjunlia vitaminophila TaxID=76728 RepID=A0A0T6LKG4_WENVI|nr:prenyltransferase/squalene oxidase repeat-containing protein [Wenjunlia vitaminophila]KRV46595.1 hypothetical protein AQ490_12015 [Wenjunlia vitaminophila]